MEKKIAVVGLGRVGLPLALYFAKNGIFVFGIDKNKALVKRYREGILPFRVGLSTREFRFLLGRRFLPTDDFSAIKGSDFIVIAVGAGAKNSDLFAVKSAINNILPHLRRGQCLILRSTLPPGSTKRIADFIHKRTSWRIGKTLFLAYCPERSCEGKALEELPRIPQIVGADDPKSRKKAASLLRIINKNLLFSNSTSAELAKIFSNVYRYTNFALANEFMMISENLGQNIYEVIRLVNEGYSRGGVKSPGITDGPCLPKSALLMPRTKIKPGLGSVAYDINKYTPRFLVDTLKSFANGKLRGRRAVILGLAFKRNIDDARGSLMPEVQKLLELAGCRVVTHDTFLANEKPLEAVLKNADIIFVGTDHDEYRRLSLRSLGRAVGKKAFVCDIWDTWGRGKIFYWL